MGTFADTCPELEREFDGVANAPLRFSELKSSEKTRVWWKCAYGHSWLTAPVSRKQRHGRVSGCPVCLGKTVSSLNSLKTKAPHLEREWSPKNTTRFEDVSFGSERVASWVCENGHEWECKVRDRSVRRWTCKKCKTLGFKAPWLKREWSPDNAIDFDTCSYSKPQKMKWVCEFGHTWMMLPANRVLQGQGCPECYKNRIKKLKDFRPDLEQEWSEKNGVAFDEIALCAKTVYWWKCRVCSHEWETSPGNRSRNDSGCPACAGSIFTPERAVFTKFPHLRKQWSLNNIIDPETLTYGSSTRVLWVCENRHEWESEVWARTKRADVSGCKKCKRLNLPTHIFRFYDTSKNSMPVADVARFSSSKFWWVCEKGHGWEEECAKVVARKEPCWECKSLIEKAPHLEKEWNPKNSVDFSSVNFGSNDKYLWICEKGHEWEAAVCDRTSNESGCPRCKGIHTGLEIKLEELLGVERFNQVVPEVMAATGRKYKPDAKLSDKVYVNADGLYWHNEQQKGEDYHWNARVAFEKAGLRLLQFWEDEVHNKPEIVKSMVEAVSGTTPTKLHARKCKITRPTKTQTRDFLDKNHIIGPVHFSRCLGLEYGGELVQVLTYNNTKKGLQITRTATKLHVLVRGGLSKLLEEVKNVEKPAKIITFCDLRYADGHSLVRLGFTHVCTRKNYQYAKGARRTDKRNLRVPKGIDEALEAAKKGWFRVWGAGLGKYELNLGS